MTRASVSPSEEPNAWPGYPLGKWQKQDSQEGRNVGVTLCPTLACPVTAQCCLEANLLDTGFYFILDTNIFIVAPTGLLFTQIHTWGSNNSLTSQSVFRTLNFRYKTQVCFSDTDRTKLFAPIREEKVQVKIFFCHGLAV
jgi:hypothetical protein